MMLLSSINSFPGAKTVRSDPPSYVTAEEPALGLRTSYACTPPGGFLDFFQAYFSLVYTCFEAGSSVLLLHSLRYWTASSFTGPDQTSRRHPRKTPPPTSSLFAKKNASPPSRVRKSKEGAVGSRPRGAAAATEKRTAPPTPRASSSSSSSDPHQIILMGRIRIGSLFARDPHRIRAGGPHYRL